MKRFLIIIVSFSAILWSCSCEMSGPTEFAQPNNNICIDTIVPPSNPLADSVHYTSTNQISISIGDKKTMEPTGEEAFNIICHTTNRDAYYLSFCTANEWDNLDEVGRRNLLKQHIANSRTWQEDYMIFHKGDLETLYLSAADFTQGATYVFFAAGYEVATESQTTEIFFTRHTFND